jgi:hypothetical protein
MIKFFCNRCGAEANIISRTFTVDLAVNVEVTMRAAENSSEQPHICENCLAELLMASVETFKNSKVVTSYHTAFRTATDLDQALGELEILRNEKIDLLKRAVKADDAVNDLEKKLLKAREESKLLQEQARKAKSDAEARIRQSEAQLRQRQIDEQNDPDYVAAVHRRERIRSGAQ